jgi:hypothetical protein
LQCSGFSYNHSEFTFSLCVLFFLNFVKDPVWTEAAAGKPETTCPAMGQPAQRVATLQPLKASQYYYRYLVGDRLFLAHHAQTCILWGNPAKSMNRAKLGQAGTAVAKLA